MNRHVLLVAGLILALAASVQAQVDEVWRANLVFPSSAGLKGSDVAVDAAGNVFVASNAVPTNPVTTRDKVLVQKFDPAGLSQWSRIIERTDQNLIQPRVFVRPDGTIVVVYVGTLATNRVALTMTVLGSDGTILGTPIAETVRELVDVEQSPNGDVVALAGRTVGTIPGSAVYGLTTSGSVRTAAFAALTEYPTALAVSDSNRLFVLSNETVGVLPIAKVQALDPNGAGYTYVWSRSYTDGTARLVGRDVAVKPGTGVQPVYIVGSYHTGAVTPQRAIQVTDTANGSAFGPTFFGPVTAGTESAYTKVAVADNIHVAFTANNPATPGTTGWGLAVIQLGSFPAVETNRVAVSGFGSGAVPTDLLGTIRHGIASGALNQPAGLANTVRAHTTVSHDNITQAAATFGVGTGMAAALTPDEDVAIVGYSGASTSLAVMMLPVEARPVTVTGVAGNVYTDISRAAVLANSRRKKNATLVMVAPPGGSVGQSEQGGIVSLNPDGSFKYRSPLGFGGTDRIYFAGKKIGTLSSTGITGLPSYVEVEVIANTAPIAVDDSMVCNQNSNRDHNVLTNDSDPQGDPLSISNYTAPANGTVLHVGNGVFRYTPTPGYLGPDSFTYTVTDGFLNYSVGTVNVTVQLTPVRLYSLSPNRLNATGTPANVTLTGARFEAGSKVLVGGIEVPSTFVSANQMVANLPATLTQAAGSYIVKVVNPNLSESDQKTLTVVGSPVYSLELKSLTRVGATLEAVFEAKNSGTATAQARSVTESHKGWESPTTTVLPLSVPALAPGATSQFTLTYTVAPHTTGQTTWLYVTLQRDGVPWGYWFPIVVP